MDENHDVVLAKMLQADGLPGVLVSNRPWRELSADAITCLVNTQTAIYVRDSQLVRIQRKEDGSPFLETLTETTLKGILARRMNFVRTGVKGPTHCAPPDAIVKDILALGNWPFPPLDSIIEFPVVRPDGTLITTPGYDPATRLYYASISSLQVPPIPEHPTDEEIMNAQGLIYEMIGQFPYENTASYANTIALLLTPLMRQAIAGHVPLALIDATRPGTGKSLIAETVALIATGRKATMMTAPYDDDEWRKRILSTLAEGATIITIDNIKAKLQAASLDSALTAHVFSDRILGASRNGAYPQRATWMATGNNLQVGGDLPRRCYWIRMDARTAKPWTRSGFKHDLETWVPTHRGELIAALLTLIRGWYDAGKPAMKVPIKMGSFQSWVDTIGGILEHCYVEDFLGNMQTLQEQDEDALQWAAFLHAWRAHYKDDQILSSILARDIKAGSTKDDDSDMTKAGLYNALPDDLTDIHKGDFKRRLGKALSYRVGTRFDDSGLYLVKGEPDKRSGAVFWSVAAPEQEAEYL
ncbi:hypothetical protein KDA_18830 [Dictyobacter alpinus]|uniref:DUF927 domain-containing protein n=1 Tax=Dictyobacter alpinus TaxID=2014873 RepID=A0A402B4W7_9CHLR|nr:hypothetical protein [Dictyobacter alpinus]GCE26399.1 hypothetical protein KDA_18830 [Dictyobacter alpinus]